MNFRIHQQPAGALIELSRTAPSVMLSWCRPIRTEAARELYDRARAYLDATYRERERQIACRYRLTSIWRPFNITGANHTT